MDGSVQDTVPTRLWHLWAKWSKTGAEAPEGGETYHPLLCHLLDVATVVRILWEEALPAPTRTGLTHALGLSSESDAGAWVAFFGGLHDIGKASPGFQDQLNGTSAGPSVRRWMDGAALRYASAEWVAHGAVSARVLPALLMGVGVGADLADQIATLVGGHHGIFPRADDLRQLRVRTQVGNEDWGSIRTDVVAALRAGLAVPEPAPTGTLTFAEALHLAGLVSVADWIGSNEQHFTHAGRLAATPQPQSLAEYIPLAAARAREAVRTVRMDAFGGDVALRTHRTFGDLFPHIAEPRDAQKAVIELGESLRGPALVLLEAPMGEGKTEAALFLAEAWATLHGRLGMYMALPTQATSNQMLKRAHEFLGRRFASADYVALHLVYGDAALSEEHQRLLQQGRLALGIGPATTRPLHVDAGTVAVPGDSVTPAGDDQSENAAPAEPLPFASQGPIYEGRGAHGADEGTVVAVEWFAAPKRALLAPFGVGTIDQALLGVLQTKHFFVRLFGLAGKTVIVDEVHAYDTYMSTLLERLLEWLGAYGVPVVLLSATLPSAKRAQLQAAYAGGAGWPVPPSAQLDVAYPRLSWVSAEGAHARAVVASSAMSRTVAVEWLDAGPPNAPEANAALAERLRSALEAGGCAAVICNTVGRAQEVYRALQPFFPGDADDGLPELDLFHARFLRGARQEIEQRVLRRFGTGEGTRRPNRAVLVATQVIEQSLDLDFDLMISDLAPVDLLLQRSGRLHRHSANTGHRPAAVSTPRLVIPRPQTQDDCPAFPRSDEFIYDAHILLRTWLALRERVQIRVPEEIEELVETVYDLTTVCPADASPALRDLWEASRQQYEKEVARDQSKAIMRRVPSPRDVSIFTGRNLALLDADEAPHADETAIALTRLGPPSVRVVVLSAAQARRQLAARGQPPDARATRRLLRHSVSLAHGAIAPALIQQEPPTHWKKSAWLRHARLVALDANNRASIAIARKEGSPPRIYELELDPTLGIVIRRQAEGGD